MIQICINPIYKKENWFRQDLGKKTVLANVFESI